jgi:hypothetical protein
MKNFYIHYNIGKSKYVVKFHNGEVFYSDGSPFYDIKIFKNKILLGRFIKELLNSGYVEI